MTEQQNTTPPPIPDGMPDGTEWRRVQPDRAYRTWTVGSNPRLWFHEAIAHGLTALAFLMPDGTWEEDWVYMNPLRWLHQDPNDKVYYLYRRPLEGEVRGPISASYALIIPPRVYSAEGDDDES